MDDNKLIQENEPKDLSFTAIYGSQFRDYQEKVQEGEEPAAKTLPSSISEEDMQALQRSKEQVLIGRTAKRKLEEEQRRKSRVREKAPKPKKERTAEPGGKLGAGRIVGRVLTVVLTTVLAVVLALVVIVASIIHGPSESARDTFVTTVLESGNLKFLATMFLSEDEINEIVSRTSMGEMETDIDEGMIATDTPVEGNFDEHGVEIVQVNGRSFFGTLMIVADPSQVFVGTTYPWGEYGKELGQLCDMHQAVGPTASAFRTARSC